MFVELSAPSRRAAAGTLFLAALLAGSGWIAFDLWSAHEESELVGVPWRWMRLFANVVFLAIILALLGQAIKSKRP